MNLEMLTNQLKIFVKAEKLNLSLSLSLSLILSHVFNILCHL